MGEQAGGFSDRLLFACVFFCFAATLNTQTFGLLLTRVAANTGMSIAGMGGLRTLENAATIVVAVLIAPRVDRYPRRLPLSIGFCSAIAASLILWKFPTTLGVGIYLVLNGTAVMLCVSTALSIPGDYLRGRQLTRAMGFMIAGFSLTEILFLPLAGTVADRYGWRAGFLLTSVLLVVGLLLALSVAPGRSSVHHAVSAADLRRGYRQFLENRQLLIMLGAALMRFALYGAMVTFLSSALITRFGLSVSSVGVIFAAVGAMSFSGSVLSGYLMHSGRYRLVLIDGGLILAVLIFAGLALNPGVAVTIGLIFFVMFGLSIQENASTLAVLHLSGDSRGAAMSLNELSAAAGALTGIALGSIGIKWAGVTGLGLVLTILCLLGSAGTWFVLRRSDDPAATLLDDLTAT